MSNRRKSPLELDPVQPHMCSIELRLKILEQVPFFAELPHQTIEKINQDFIERGFTEGETIYFAGDPANRFYVVADGNVKLLRHSWEGKDILLDLLTPGEFFGSLSTHEEGNYPDTAQAMTSACVLTISTLNFRAILERYPAVAIKVLDLHEPSRKNTRHDSSIECYLC